MGKHAAVAVSLNIAFRPRSGDLIVMNAGLAKPIPRVLVYSQGSPDMPQKCLLQCAACALAGPRATLRHARATLLLCTIETLTSRAFADQRNRTHASAENSGAAQPVADAVKEVPSLLSPREALVLFAVIDSAGDILAMIQDGFECGCRSACSRVAKDCRVPSLDSPRSATPMIPAAARARQRIMRRAAEADRNFGERVETLMKDKHLVWCHRTH